MNEQLLTAEDVAAMFQVTPYTVREWAKSKKLEGTKPNGKDWRFTQAAVNKLATQTYGD